MHANTPPCHVASVGTRRVFLVLAVWALAILSGAVSASSASAAEGWRWQGSAAVESAYDSNVFHLSDAAKHRVDRQDPVDRANGRIRDMESVDDFIFSPRLAVGGESKNRFGSFSIVPRAEYHFHIKNDAKNYPDIGLELRQTLPGHSVVTFDADVELGVFKKNYLEGTTVPGEVSADQRIYGPGIYDDYAVALEWERRLWRSNDRIPRVGVPSKLTGSFETTYTKRRFHDFSNRNLDVFGGRALLATSSGEWMKLDLAYRFDYRAAPGGSEVVIIDEPALGSDLTGDADALDQNVSTTTNVDRSRFQHEIRVKLRGDPTRRLRATVAYEYMLMNYLSDEPLDLGHNGRIDNQHVIGGGLRWEFRESWYARVKSEYSIRESNESFSQLEEDDPNKSGWTTGLSLTRSF